MDQAAIADVRQIALREAQAAIAVLLTAKVRNSTKDPKAAFDRFELGYLSALTDALSALESVRVEEPE